MQNWEAKCASLEAENPEALNLLYHLAYWNPDNLPKLLIYELQKNLSTPLEDLISILIRNGFMMRISDDQFQIKKDLQTILPSKIENLEPLQTVLNLTVEQCNFDQYCPESYSQIKSLLPHIEHLLASVSKLSPISLSQEIAISAAKLARVLGEYRRRVEHEWQRALTQFQ